MKKLISALLVLAMVFAMFPTLALIGSAEGEGAIVLPGDCFHSRLSYTDNGDGTHTVTCLDCSTVTNAAQAHTYSNGVCTLCGATEAATGPIEVSDMTIGTTLTLTSSLAINFRVKNVDAAKYDLSTSYLVVEMDKYPAGGEMFVQTDTFTEYTIQSQRVCFSYTGIAAAEMNDEVRATFYVEGLDGKLYCSPVKVTSICGYVQTALAANPTAALRTCLIDMVNYGAAAQTYFGRHTDALANEAFEAYQQYASTGLASEVVYEKATVATGCETNLVSKVGTTLDLGSSIGIKYTVTGTRAFTTADLATAKLVIKDSQGNIIDTIQGSSLSIDSKNRIVGYTYVLAARQMRDAVSMTLYLDDTLVSDSYVYSIASYLTDVVNNMPGTALEDMIRAMVIYGDAADNAL